jgi:hypothetical protein
MARGRGDLPTVPGARSARKRKNSSPRNQKSARSGRPMVGPAVHPRAGIQGGSCLDEVPSPRATCRSKPLVSPLPARNAVRTEEPSGTCRAFPELVAWPDGEHARKVGTSRSASAKFLIAQTQGSAGMRPARFTYRCRGTAAPGRPEAAQGWTEFRWSGSGWSGPKNEDFRPGSSRIARTTGEWNGERTRRGAGHTRNRRGHA